MISFNLNLLIKIILISHLNIMVILLNNLLIIILLLVFSCFDLFYYFANI